MYLDEVDYESEEQTGSIFCTTQEVRSSKEFQEVKVENSAQTKIISPHVGMMEIHEDDITKTSGELKPKKIKASGRRNLMRSLQ